MIAEFSVVPVGGKKRLGREIAKALEVVERSGLKYELTAMGTIIQGPWDRVMETIKKAHLAVRKGSGRALTHIALDDRVGAHNPITAKVESVKRTGVPKKKKTLSKKK